MAWSEIFKIYGAGRGNIKKKFNGKIMDRNCDYGDVNGHKSVPILNFPDWYKDLQTKKFEPASNTIANLVDIHFDKE